MVAVLQIGRDINVRDDNTTSVIGHLKKGSIVSIPDDAIVKENNKINLEKTIYGWLSQLTVFDGQKKDYFSKVTVVKAAPGSRVPSSKVGFIALRYLLRSGNLFVVGQDTDLRTTPASQVVPASLEAGISCTDCQPSSPFHAMVEPLLAGADRAGLLNRARLDRDSQEFQNTFTRTCGISWNKFEPEAEVQEKNLGLSQGTILRVLSQESSGNCLAINGNDNGNRSVGLFQINAHDSTVRTCSNTERENIQNGASKNLKIEPKCLENPYFNLEQFVTRTKAKQQVLVQPTVTIEGTKFNGFDPQALNANPELKKRLSLSIHHSGPRWALEAKRQMELYNLHNNTNLSPNNWLQLRPFYLASAIPKSSQVSFFGEARDGRRKTAFDDLAFVDSIGGLGRISTN